MTTSRRLRKGRVAARLGAGALRATGVVVGLCLLLGAIGVLGMHSPVAPAPTSAVTSAGAHHGAAADAAVDGPDVLAVAVISPDDDQPLSVSTACPMGTCAGSTHGSLTTAACMLALLAVALVLLVPSPRAVARAASSHRRPTTRVSTRALAWPRPLSLHVLSISRT